MVAHEYPPERWDATEIADALRESNGSLGIPTYDDEDFWISLRDEDLTTPAVNDVLEAAQTTAAEPIPRLPATHYLRWVREENITQPEIRAPLNERLDRLSALALGECILRDGRYLDDILDFGWAICEQSQWSQAPKVLSEARNCDGLPVETAPERRRLALRTMSVAKTLAHLYYVLGDRLHPALRERIRTEVKERVIEPFEHRNDLWWMSPPTNNWNAAQNGGAIMTGLLLLDNVDRVARIVKKAATNMKYYLKGFDSDGCTPEGVGYWNFGFGNYVSAAAYLEAFTDGAYSLFSPPIIKRIAEYPLKVELSPGRFVPFSDSLEEQTIEPATACFLGERYEIRQLAARGRQEFQDSIPVDRLDDAVRCLAWCQSTPELSGDRRWMPNQYFEGFQWWIARSRPDSESLVVAVKGGHNDEPHNHNDCGSIVIHCAGESLVTDLGKPPQGYPDGYFDADRYQKYLLVRSLGHSVPVIDGTEQAAGEGYAATVVDQTTENDRKRFVVELSGCYPVESLASLHRMVSLRDGATDQVTIKDSVEFTNRKRHKMESVFVSYFPMTRDAETLVVRGDRGDAQLTPDTEVELTIECLENDVPDRTVWRARFTVPVEDGEGECGFSVAVERT